MWFWWFVVSLSISVIMILAGERVCKYGNIRRRPEEHIPKKIGEFYAYRSFRSMKNADTWEFAHNYCGRLWHKLGWSSLILTILLQVSFYAKAEDTIRIFSLGICIVQLVPLVSPFFLTENVLKKTFLMTELAGRVYHIKNTTGVEDYPRPLFLCTVNLLWFAYTVIRV